MIDTSVPFELRANLVIVEVALNGVPTPMILDTGAAASAISFEAAAKAAVSGVEQIAGVGVGGAAEMSIGRLDRLEIGELTLRDLTMAIMEIGEIRSRLGGELGGVLGFDVFGRGRLEIDYPARRVRLVSPKELGGGDLVVSTDRIASERWRFELARPGAGWSLVERPSLPHTKLLARHSSGAELEITVVEAHGLGLEQLRLSVEASLPLQVERFTLLGSRALDVGFGRWLEHSYAGADLGTTWRYLTRSTTTASSIVSATVSSPESRWQELETDLLGLIDSLRLN